MSIYGLIHYRKSGSLPGSAPQPSDPIEDQTKYAFSSNPHDELDEDVEDHAVRTQRHEDDEYALLHTNTEDGTHPGRPLSWGREHVPSPFSGEDFDKADTSYRGGRQYNKSAQHDTDGDGDARLPPLRTNPYDTNDTNDTSYHGRESPLPPRRHAEDPFRDDLALSHDHGGFSSESRVNFPHGEYHR